MINLLLPAQRKLARAEYRHRLFIVGGLLTFSLIMVVLIIISSFAFILSRRRAEVLEQIAAARREFAGSDLETARRAVSDINSLIKTLATPAGHESIAAVYRQLIEARPSGIQLTKLEWQRAGVGQIEISGRSETRAALLAYIDSLETDPYFQKVASPVKNIIRERDISFNLTVTLAPPKIL